MHKSPGAYCRDIQPVLPKKIGGRAVEKTAIADQVKKEDAGKVAQRVSRKVDTEQTISLIRGSYGDAWKNVITRG